MGKLSENEHGKCTHEAQRIVQDEANHSCLRT